MKIIRTISRHPAVIAALIVTFLNVSCNSNLTEETWPNTEEMTATSKRVFKGVMFGDGDFVSEIPVIKNNFNKEQLLTQAQLKEYRKVENEIIAYIDAHNPEFWSLFYQNVSSPSPLKIKQALIDASVVIKEVFLEKYAVDIEKEILKFESLDQEKKERVIESLKNGNQEDISELMNFDIANINAISPNQQECVYEAIVLVAVGAVAVGVYIWLAYARWETVTYPESGAAYSPSNALVDNEIIGQIGNYFNE